jgi:hypothetical protein
MQKDQFRKLPRQGRNMTYYISGVMPRYRLVNKRMTV